MRSIVRRSLALAGFLAVLLGQTYRLTASDPGTPADVLVVTLRAAATVSGSQVTLGDVADLRGGEPSQRQRLARLDLAELPLSSQPILVTQQQIGFRLRIAGLDERAFRMEGPRLARVSRPAAEALDNKIAAAAREALRQKLTARSEDVTIQLAQPVRLPTLSADGEDIHLEAEVRSLVVVPSRILVEVGIYVRGARRMGMPVYFDLKKVQSIPVAVRRIEIGETFSANNIRVERAPIENNQGTVLDAASLMGRRASRPVSAGRAIEAQDLQTDTPASILINQGDLVQLIAKVGPLQVRTRGQAMQVGRAGQLIQVRNSDSKSIVTGRVVDRSTVAVDY